jgi:hypothetical protein
MWSPQLAWQQVLHLLPPLQLDQGVDDWLTVTATAPFWAELHLGRHLRKEGWVTRRSMTAVQLLAKIKAKAMQYSGHAELMAVCGCCMYHPLHLGKKGANKPELDEHGNQTTHAHNAGGLRN